LSDGIDDCSRSSVLGHKVRYKLGYTRSFRGKKLNEINIMAASSLRSERTKGISH
jgi:hypothetical protein